jgi:2-keto-4-pentenoate hydratase
LAHPAAGSRRAGGRGTEDLAHVIAATAKMLVEAQRSRMPAAAGQITLQSADEAYGVQDAVYGELWPGARPVAWKVGGPSDKVEPTAAPIPPEKLLRSPASVSGAKMQMIGVEAEVAFRLGRDLQPQEVLVTIELCDTRLANWKESSALMKLADFQNHSALVAGSGTKDWQEIDFRQQEVEFRIGKRIAKAKGAHPFGNPVRLLPWLAAHCAKRGLGGFGLHAGDVITTGAWTGLEIANAGDEVTAIFPGIGEATVRIT